MCSSLCGRPGEHKKARRRLEQFPPLTFLWDKMVNVRQTWMAPYLVEWRSQNVHWPLLVYSSSCDPVFQISPLPSLKTLVETGAKTRCLIFWLSAGDTWSTKEIPKQDLQNVFPYKTPQLPSQLTFTSGFINSKTYNQELQLPGS